MSEYQLYLKLGGIRYKVKKPRVYKLTIKLYKDSTLDNTITKTYASGATISPSTIATEYLPTDYEVDTTTPSSDFTITSDTTLEIYYKASATPTTGNCLKFESDTPFTIAINLENFDGSLFEYSLDNSTWNSYETDTEIEVANAIYLRGKEGSIIGTTNTLFTLTNDTNTKVSGKLSALLDYTQDIIELMNGVEFEFLFGDLTNLVDASKLDLSNITPSESCYDSMFYGCTSLTSAPTLPATTLALACYASMFYGCTSLTSAPTLPATTLALGCYALMFYGCTSLTSAPTLPATTLADSCYYRMFYGCTSLTTPPALPATTLATHCCFEMFYGCTSLTSAPTLPATTLADSCYRDMFNGCTALTTPPALPATTLADSCYRDMFNRCTSLKLSTTQTNEYKTPYRIPTSGTGTTATNALLNMFANTGGTFTGTPTINTTYYGAWD